MWFRRDLRVLDSQLGGNLVVCKGNPASVLAKLCHEVAASSVHCAADFGAYGAGPDEAAAQALPVPLVRTGGHPRRPAAATGTAAARGRRAREARR
jgi:hypothetical protein